MTGCYTVAQIHGYEVTRLLNYYTFITDIVIDMEMMAKET